VACAYNPSYLGDWDWKDQVSRPVTANSFQDFISKITRVKWIGGVTWAVEHLLCSCEALSSNPSPTKSKQPTRRTTKTVVCTSSLIKVNFESNIEENSRNWKRRGGKQCIQVTRKAQASKQSHVIVIWRSSGQWPLEAEFCYIYRGHLFSCIPNTSFCGTLHLLYLFLVLASWITWNLTPVHSW
jgi:hypothetical protein